METRQLARWSLGHCYILQHFYLHWLVPWKDFPDGSGTGDSPYYVMWSLTWQQSLQKISNVSACIATWMWLCCSQNKTQSLWANIVELTQCSALNQHVLNLEQYVQETILISFHCVHPLHILAFFGLSCGFIIIESMQQVRSWSVPPQAGGTSDYPGCRGYFPELRSCFVLHSTSKHNNTMAIGKTVHIAYSGILCFLSFIICGTVPST